MGVGASMLQLQPDVRSAAIQLPSTQDVAIGVYSQYDRLDGRLT